MVFTSLWTLFTHPGALQREGRGLQAEERGTKAEVQEDDQERP